MVSFLGPRPSRAQCYPQLGQNVQQAGQPLLGNPATGARTTGEAVRKGWRAALASLSSLPSSLLPVWFFRLGPASRPVGVPGGPGLLEDPP